MGRKRPPEHDYICRRCGCACELFGGKHLGGGSSDMKACGKPADPVLRSVWEAHLAADAKAVAEIIRGLRYQARSVEGPETV